MLAPPPGSGGSVLGYPGRGAPPSGGAAGGSDLTAQLLDRVSALEEQVRSLRGQIDQIGNETRQQGQDSAKQIGDLNFRVQTLEGGRGHCLSGSAARAAGGQRGGRTGSAVRSAAAAPPGAQHTGGQCGPRPARLRQRRRRGARGAGE